MRLSPSLAAGQSVGLEPRTGTEPVKCLRESQRPKVRWARTGLWARRTRPGSGQCAHISTRWALPGSGL